MRQMVADNKAKRDRASVRMSRLVSATLSGDDNDFRETARSILDEATDDLQPRLEDEGDQTPESETGA